MTRPWAGIGAGRVEIVDSDPQQQLPILWVTSSSVVEGDSATRIAQVKIELSRPAAGVVVSYESVDSGALAGSDYTAKFPGTVVFGAGRDVQVARPPGQF